MASLDTLQSADPAPVSSRGGPARSTQPAASGAADHPAGFAGQLDQALGQPGIAAPAGVAAGAATIDPVSALAGELKPGDGIPADTKTGDPQSLEAKPASILPQLLQPGIPIPTATGTPQPAPGSRLAKAAGTAEPAEKSSEDEAGQPALLVAVAAQPVPLPPPSPPPPPKGAPSPGAEQGAASLQTVQGRGRATPAAMTEEKSATLDSAAAETKPALTAQTAVAASAPVPAPETLLAASAPPPAFHPSPPVLQAGPAPEALPPAPASPPAAPSPAEQVAPALVAPVLFAIAAPSQAGAAQTLTIRLDPAELGRVQVRIERSAEGPAKVELAVERTDTLLMLLRDQPQLQQALDQAGVPPEGRTLHFSLSSDSSPMGAGASFAGDSGSGGGQRSAYGQAGTGSGPSLSDAAPASRSNWGRAGLDITA